MSRITGVIVALATTAAALTGSATGAAPPPAPASASDGPGVADLPREIEGGVQLTLADGDLLRVWASDDHRTVRARRRDASASAWSDPVVVLRKKNLFCGDVDARTANGAVAVLAECDRYGYYEDQAPVASHALWSADTVSWSSYELEGEAYEEPGIAPGGSRAVYPEFEGYVTFGPEGFTRHRLETPGQEYTATAAITDDGLVSYLYGSGQARRCRIVVLTRTGDAAPLRQELDPANACMDTALVNVDADTVLFGELADPGQVAVISRADGASPWAVTQVAPATAPGLDVVERRLYTRFFTAPDRSLVAVGSAGGRRVQAQLYDRAAQAWGAPTAVHDSRARCRWGSVLTEQQLQVVAVVVRCGGSNVVITTRDGRAWQALRSGERPLGPSADGRYVAVPGPTATHVISPELGVVTLPGGTTGRCDVVVPDGPHAAVQLVARPGTRRWPTLLRHVSADGTSRLGRFRSPTPGRCGEAELAYDRPVHFQVRSTVMDRGHDLRILRRGDGWTARLTPW